MERSTSFFMGKSTNFLWPFSIAMWLFTRGYLEDKTLRKIEFLNILKLLPPPEENKHGDLNINHHFSWFNGKSKPHVWTHQLHRLRSDRHRKAAPRSHRSHRRLRSGSSRRFTAHWRTARPILVTPTGDSTGESRPCETKNDGIFNAMNRWRSSQESSMACFAPVTCLAKPT